MASGQVRVSAGAAGDFAALARDLRRAGAKSLQRELYAGLQRSGRPAIDAARESAEKTLPTGRGAYQSAGKRKRRKGKRAARQGLGQRVAAASYRIKLTNRRGEVRLVVTAAEKGRAKADVQALDNGLNRHPLFGNRQHWYKQPVRPGWFTRPMRAQADAVSARLRVAVDKVTDEIERG